jgi:hypothetical protein
MREPRFLEHLKTSRQAETRPKDTNFRWGGRDFDIERRSKALGSGGASPIRGETTAQNS